MAKIDQRLVDLLKKYEVDTSGVCWLWTKSLDSHGYGHLRQNGKLTRAHRFFFAEATGEMIDGMTIMHKCDNPRCVNPDHLTAGTQLENIADRVAKGRNGAARGEYAPWSKLTEAAVKEIKDLFNSGVNRTAIMDKFCISKTQLYRVVNGNSWRHV